MHRLLARQLKNKKIEVDKTPSLEQWQTLLAIIDRTYRESDEARYLSERSLEMASREMKEKFEKFQVMSSQLAQAGKMATMGTLASNIAHELNNPLAGIKGYNEILLMRGGLTAQQIETIQKILRLTSRMEEIVALVRKEARQNNQTTPAVFSLMQPLNDAIELLSKQFMYENINVQITTEESDLFILGNAGRLESVFQNLMTNSRGAFLEHPGICNKEISIDLKRLSDDKLLITFSDNAGGIPLKIMNQIFEPFFTTKPIGVGTGLGLSLCKQIVIEHKGSIEVESQDGFGTTFKIFLPLEKRVLAENITTIKESSNKSIVSNFPSKEFKTLIIDDEEDIVYYLNAIFGDVFDVSKTSSPTEALKAMEHAEFDLVITDLKMPQVNGYQIIAAAKEKCPNAAIVVISGHAEASSFENHDSRILFIPKPLPKPDEMLTKVIHHMKQFRRRSK